MKRVFIIVSAALAAVSFAPASASADKKRHAGNAVTRWVEHALDGVRTQNVGAPNAGRLYAMVNVAMYDAVNGIDRARGHGRTHALVAPSGAPVKGNRDVAAAAAAHAVLTAVLRTDQPPVSMGALDAALAVEVEAAGDAEDPPVSSGRDWGARIGREVVAIRSSDGTQAAERIGACSRFSDPTACEPGEVPHELRCPLAAHDALRDRECDGVRVGTATGAEQRRVRAGVR